MTLSLLGVALIAMAFLSTVFIPICAAAWWQEEEHCKRRMRQFATIPVSPECGW